MTVRIGLSGWSYPGWRRRFYPTGLPQRRELEYIANLLGTVEINGSFYSLQRPSSYRSWAAQTPPDFVFAVKGSRFITHLKKLRDVETPLANFFASGLLTLEEKLGPILWQLPPNLAFNEPVLSAFLSALPRSTTEATYLARRHDERLTDRAWTCTSADRPLRHVLEVRHESYRDPRLLALLREQGVGLVVADTAQRWPMLFDVTADLVYVRLHGNEELYVSGYDHDALQEWAGRIRQWDADGLDVYVYFDNDAKVRAPVDAIALQELGGGRRPIEGRTGAPPS
jgi:uncharacterized protein YecE (DUF72 family)